MPPASDSDQTQDSQPEAIPAEADATSAPPAATRGPAHQGNAGRALPHAEEGMYTGAFAFPDSASLEVSQLALDPLPHKPGKGRPGIAARPAARGKAAKAAAAVPKATSEAVAQQGKGTAAEAGKKSASAVRDDRADAAQDASSAGAGAGAGGGASSGASPKGRVMPSGWRKKKADPAADGHADSTVEEATEDAGGPSAEPSAGLALHMLTCGRVNVNCMYGMLQQHTAVADAQYGCMSQLPAILCRYTAVMLCSFAKLESLHCHVAHAFVRLQTQHFVCCMQEGHAVYYLTWIPGHMSC